MLYALDTETTGVDFYHGPTSPFFLTICRLDEEPEFWEWPVDPLTREVLIPQADLDEIQALLYDEEITWTGQNIKFDVTALKKIIPGLQWDWKRTRDTIIASHLLRSNQRHGLDYLSVMYLGVDISRYEEKLEQAVQECRRKVRTKKWIEKYGVWRLAKKDLPDMPSAKEKTWKFDTWLPRAVAARERYQKHHHYWTVLRDYAVVDSKATVQLWPIMKEKLEQEGLLEIYEVRMQAPVFAHRMEQQGVTLNGERTKEQTRVYVKRAEDEGKKITDVAGRYGIYDLQLPKGDMNDQLREFIFGTLKVEPLEISVKTNKPRLDKNILDEYLITLDGDQLEVLRALKNKRSLDAAVRSLKSYQRFWVPLGIFNDLGEQLWYLIHPGFNPTGSQTLRWSSSNPNGQNVSKKEGFNLRYCFGPAPGREWWSLDAANIELRIPAYESGEPDLITLFERPNDPPYYGSQHLLNFSTVYPDIWEGEFGKFCDESECCRGRVVDEKTIGPHCKHIFKPTWYQWCKNGDFAIQYQCGERTADKSFRKKGAYRLLKERFSKQEALNQKYLKQARDFGYVETLPDKSINCGRAYPLWVAQRGSREVKPTLPLNYHVQGTAMWWMLKAMIRVQEFLDAEFPQGKIALQVHDELVLDFPKGRGLKPERTHLRIVKEIKRLMELGGEDIGIPTPCSVEYHPVSWDKGLAIAI